MRYIASTSRRMIGGFATLGITLLALAQPALAQELIQNGGFETNNGSGSNIFGNWTVSDQSGSSGSWYAQTGTSSPTNGSTVPAPPEGSFSAMTDQSGPGSHLLYQDFVVPTGITGATLSFQVMLNNQAGSFFNPSSLDYSPDTNQQFRVDIISTSADLFSVAPTDVFLNAYQTNPGDPSTTAYFLSSTDITTLLQGKEGQTLRLRISEVDNVGIFNAGVDNVSLNVTTGATSAPEPTTCLLGLTATPLVGLVLRRRRKA